MQRLLLSSPFNDSAKLISLTACFKFVMFMVIIVLTCWPVLKAIVCVLFVLCSFSLMWTVKRAVTMAIRTTEKSRAFSRPGEIPAGGAKPAVTDGVQREVMISTGHCHDWGWRNSYGHWLCRTHAHTHTHTHTHPNYRNTYRHKIHYTVKNKPKMF